MSLLIYMQHGKHKGGLVSEEDAKVSVFDHGLLYGDGVFEGIRAYAGKVFKLQEHIDRLYNSAKAIRLDIPMTKKEMTAAVRDTVKANKLTDCYIRLIVTRGKGPMGLDPGKCVDPCVVIIATTIAMYPEEQYEKGLEIITATTLRNHPAALDPRIKSLNYLNNILAKIEADNAGTFEAIMLNTDGLVAECTGDNIFLIIEGALCTPPGTAGVLKGVTRSVVMELARKQKIEVKEVCLSRYDVYSAEECFLTGTGAEIIPVVKVDGRIIGDGKPGPITRKLLKEFRKLTKSGK
ncbi:MAG: branched-chain-amino-acid transaminase [Planctomycetes bacterium]|nr:branched-chain-amino-acid transaminase [Planctomycetota bacterium]